jgi:hypothetical protein
MEGRHLAVGLFLAATFSCGCGISQRLNGTYEGFRDIAVAPGTEPIIAQQLRMVRITAREDGHASLVDRGMAFEGTVDYLSSAAKFVPNRIAGTSINTQDPALVDKYTITLVPQKDGSWLYDGTVKLMPHRSDSGSVK